MAKKSKYKKVDCPDCGGGQVRSARVHWTDDKGNERTTILVCYRCQGLGKIEVNTKDFPNA